MSAPGERDLQRLLAGMRPELDPQTYVFATCAPAAVPAGLAPLARFSEAEGESLVIARDAALAQGITGTFACRRITLAVHSALDAVGLLAAVAQALADAGIPANTVSAYHHDHLFVPCDRAAAAVAVLEDLAAAHASSAR